MKNLASELTYVSFDKLNSNHSMPMPLSANLNSNSKLKNDCHDDKNNNTQKRKTRKIVQELVNL